MLLETMNPEEVLNELRKDDPFLISRINLLFGSLERKMRSQGNKSNNCLISETIEVVSPRRNNWIIIVRLNKKAWSSQTIAYIKGNTEFYLRTPGCNIFNYFSNHFVYRYKERFLNDTTVPTVQAMKKFFKNNPDPEKVWQNKDKRTPGELFKSVFEDGIGLGELGIFETGAVLMHNTYIRHDMVREHQLEKIIIAAKELDEKTEKNLKEYGFK